MLSDPAATAAMQAIASQDVPEPATARPRRRSGPWVQLLTALLDLADGKAELIRHAEQAWASATFSGTRHTIMLGFGGTDAITAGEALIDALPEHEFALPRHIVADAAVIAVEHWMLPEQRMTVEIELLVLDDG